MAGQQAAVYQLTRDDVFNMNMLEERMEAGQTSS